MARRKTFTQEELYQATHDLMLEVGYDNFSFQALSKKIDISRTALYKHYANKDDLLQDYLNHQLEKSVEELDSIDWPSKYPEKLSELMDLILNYADSHAISAMVPTRQWNTDNAKDPDVQRSKALHGQFFGFIQRLIEEGQEKGFLKKEIPSLVMIEMIFHSINLPNRSGLPVERHASFIKQILFEGILK